MKNRLPIRVWLRALKLNARSLWLRVFPRMTLEKQINELREQNEGLQKGIGILKQTRVELRDELFEEKTHNANLLKSVQELEREREKWLEEKTHNAKLLRSLERERERWVAKTLAHRDARRKICKVLNELGKEDSFAEPNPMPQPNYRQPTVEDLKDGPIPVEVSNDGENWAVYWLFGIGDHPNPYCCRFLNDKNAECRFFYLARVAKDAVDAKNKTV